MNTYAVWRKSEYAEAYSLEYVGPFTNATTVLSNEHGAVMRRASKPVADLYAQAEQYAQTWQQNAISRWCAWTNAYGLDTQKWYWVDLGRAADELVECASIYDAYSLLAEAVFVPRRYVGYGFRNAL